MVIQTNRPIWEYRICVKRISRYWESHTLHIFWKNLLCLGEEKGGGKRACLPALKVTPNSELSLIPGKVWGTILIAEDWTQVSSMYGKCSPLCAISLEPKELTFEVVNKCHSKLCYYHLNVTSFLFIWEDWSSIYFLP